MFSPRMFLVLFLTSFVISKEDESSENAKQSMPTPNIPSDAFTALFFDSPSLSSANLIISSAKKDGADDAIAKYDGVWSVEVEETSAFIDDYTLVLKSKAKHHAVSWRLSKPINFDTKELVIQYEVKFASGMDCGGAYIKLLSGSPELQLNLFNDKTPYTIMFGPDKCGLDHKFHFIIRYKNPKTGIYEEKHAKKIDGDIEKYFSDKRTHLYTLVIRNDSSFERYIDRNKVQSGSLLTDLEPPINPPAEIDDPNDVRPSDWDDREMIPDPDAQKPADWDEDAPEYIIDETATKPVDWLDNEPEMIPDTSVEKPKDWDSEMDVEWEPPMIKNPKCVDAPGCGEWHPPKVKNINYQGKWSAPLIRNPAYKGIWKPAKIPNPDYFFDDAPYKSLAPVTAVGLELWSMTENIVFDNFLIVDSLLKADAFAKETWVIKYDAEHRADSKAQSVVDAVRDAYKEKPLIVVLVGLACTLPFVLCLWWICRPSKRSVPASHKKTDAYTPDDMPPKYDSSRPEKGEAVEDEEEEEEEENAEGSEDDLVQVQNVPTTEEESNKVDTKADLESESDDPVEKEPVQTEKTNIRKRRSRKE